MFRVVSKDHRHETRWLCYCTLSMFSVIGMEFDRHSSHDDDVEIAIGNNRKSK